MASKIDMNAVAGLAEAIDGVPTSGEVASAVAAAVAALPAAVGPDVGDYCWSARAAKTKWLLCDGAAISRTTYAALFAQIATRYGSGDGSTTFNIPKSAGRTLIAAGTGTVAEAVAAAAVNATTDVITVASNFDKWITGMKVRLTTTTTLPAGLSLATDYFVIRVTATTIKLATSLANAIAGTAINITSAGTGTHTITHTLSARALGEIGGEETHGLTVTEMPAHTHTGTQTTSANLNTVGDPGTPPSPGDTGSAGGSGAHNIMQPYQVENLFIYTGV